MASNWKQTIDGQWQFFCNLSENSLIKEGVYKPNAKTPGDSKIERF